MNAIGRSTEEAQQSVPTALDRQGASMQAVPCEMHEIVHIGWIGLGALSAWIPLQTP